ncbi:hypothetical protein D5R81_11950 [Parashewanella spongiae]|uniref:Response regulator n=1 Tax=Parashewanella spongiae TaxID=342950 RepID=A0A3A6TX88_9GAMM|nr:hypothetical protein [Parashewanella spongiae]MCL1078616.1 hypothetical protein [Parashewanella spongiae]RJY13019.1 hypothetical protein D5R81_11950 [Parashewanella spongiae]
MKLHHLVAQIIIQPNFDYFTAIEMRSAFLALSDDKNLDPDATRRFVYTQLTKLVKNEWLIKSVSEGRKITSYIKTEKFDVDAIITKPLTIVNTNKTTQKSDESNLSKTLNKRRNDYKDSLLIGLGEADEYKTLYGQFPDLQSKLQPKYNEVRERNSKLLGKIKAVENLLSVE